MSGMSWSFFGGCFADFEKSRPVTLPPDSSTTGAPVGGSTSFPDGALSTSVGSTESTSRTKTTVSLVFSLSWGTPAAPYTSFTVAATATRAP